MQKLEELLLAYLRDAGPYPVLLGDENDMARLTESLTLPEDQGTEAIAAAANLDCNAWFKQMKMRAPRTFSQNQGQSSIFALLVDSSGKQYKASVHIALLDLKHPSHLCAWMGFGDWNDCPPAPVHVALHAYWQKEYDAYPLAISADTLEFLVLRPANEQQVCRLAGEQYAYCYDIVEQGCGTKTKLAGGLLHARLWFFWWD